MRPGGSDMPPRDNDLRPAGAPTDGTVGDAWSEDTCAHGAGIAIGRGAWNDPVETPREGLARLGWGPMVDVGATRLISRG
jgi:hypothetical protein